MSYSRARQFHIRRGVGKSEDTSNSECKYCHELGHIIRGCPKLALKEQRRRRAGMEKARQRADTLKSGGFVTAKRTFRRRNNKNSGPVLTFNNRFADFDHTETSTEPEKVSPAVPKKSKRLALQGSWLTPLEILVSKGEAVRPIPPPTRIVKKSPTKKPRWADVADAESDDDSDSDDDFLC